MSKRKKPSQRNTDQAINKKTRNTKTEPIKKVQKYQSKVPFLKRYQLTLIVFLITLIIVFYTSKVFKESSITYLYTSKNTFLLYLSLFSIGCVLISLLKAMWLKIVAVNWVVIFLILGGFEYYMRATNYDDILNYSEVNGSGFTTDYINYKKAFDQRYKGIQLYQHPQSNDVYDDNKPEFHNIYQLDAYGNNNSSACGKAGAKINIMTIGDSFTFGLGASANKSWPNQLANILDLNDISASVCNVATPGSDPIYMFDVYKKVFMNAYSGDLLLVNINASDAKDVAIRGGIDRYQKEFVIKNQEWLPYYASSLIYRMYLQKSRDLEPYLLVERKKIDSLYLNAFDHIFNTMIEFDQFARQNNKQVVFIFNPGYHELMMNELVFQPIVDEARNFNFHVIDLFPVYQYAIQQTGNIFDFFWEKDFHNNEQGYKIWADAVYSYLAQNHLLE